MNELIGSYFRRMIAYIFVYLATTYFEILIIYILANRVALGITTEDTQSYIFVYIPLSF